MQFVRRRNSDPVPVAPTRAALALLGLAGTAVAAALFPATVLAAACTPDTIARLCAPAVDGDATHRVQCDIDFNTLDCERAAGRSNTITRRLLVEGAEASDLRLDFNDALIDGTGGPVRRAGGDTVEIRSRLTRDGTWSRPERVTLANARIRGSLRVFGMGRNGEADAVRESSLRPGHRQRIRNAAPRDIVLTGLTLTGIGRNVLYLAPGVTRTSVRESRLDGHSSRVAIYLDAESQAITIEANTIATRTGQSGVLGFFDRGWPQLAIDTSSLAVIRDNRFIEPTNGGIFLYRNCGEGGTVRHGTPSNNAIIGNTFVYPDARVPRDPAIFIGSRGYGWLEEHWPGSHCDDDSRLARDAIGSALSNGDFASFNRVIDNRFVLGDERARDVDQSLGIDPSPGTGIAADTSTDSATGTATGSDHSTNTDESFVIEESSRRLRAFIAIGDTRENTGNQLSGNHIVRRRAH